MFLLLNILFGIRKDMWRCLIIYSYLSIVILNYVSVVLLCRKSHIDLNLIPGPNDAPLASTSFEAFLKVPEFLRPHTQIYCTRYYPELVFISS